MLPLLKCALIASAKAIQAESERIPVHHLNESIFRFFFQRALLTECPTVELLPECRKVDLVVRDHNDVAFIELKYLVHSRCHEPETLLPLASWKSYPSPANRRQFLESIEKLRGVSPTQGISRAVALFYADPSPGRARTYHSWYGSPDMPRDAKLCLVESAPPFRCAISNATCHTTLWEPRV